MNFKTSTGPGIIIGIPTLGRPVPLSWALQFKGLNPPINFNTTFHIIEGQEVGVARNEMAKNAIEKDAKYLFFIGDDVVVPSHALRLMIYKMEQDETIGVIGGVYCAKADPAFPLVFRGDGQGSYWDWKIGEFFEVTGLGMDCTIIRVSLLKELQEKEPKKALFETVRKDEFLDGRNNAEEWTEDLFFLNRVRTETKWKIYCEGGIICDHWDVKSGKKWNLPKDSLPMRTLMLPSGADLLDVGGFLKEASGFNIVRFGDYEGADFRGQATSLPFDKESYDAVNIPATELTTLTRIPEVLKEAVRVLKPNGIIKITHSKAISEDYLWNSLTELGIECLMSKDCLIEGKKNGNNNQNNTDTIT